MSRDIVIVLVGIEHQWIPSICYRTRDEAMEIIMTFISDRRMNENFHWVRLRDINYDRGRFYLLFVRRYGCMVIHYKKSLHNSGDFFVL